MAFGALYYLGWITPEVIMHARKKMEDVGWAKSNKKWKLAANANQAP